MGVGVDEARTHNLPGGIDCARRIGGRKVAYGLYPVTRYPDVRPKGGFSSPVDYIPALDQ